MPTLVPDKVSNNSSPEKPFTAMYCVHPEDTSVLISLPDLFLETCTSVFSILDEMPISTSDDAIVRQRRIFDVFPTSGRNVK